jgi:hypothetical protein
MSLSFLTVHVLVSVHILSFHVLPLIALHILAFEALLSLVAFRVLTILIVTHVVFCIVLSIPRRA